MDHIITKNIKKAGKPGTKKYVKIYGDDLINVRYKYDYKRKKKYKTIELCVEESDWHPSEKDKYRHRRVYIRILSYERRLREHIKKAGGIWNNEKKLWKVSIQVVWDLNLEDRFVCDDTKT